MRSIVRLRRSYHLLIGAFACLFVMLQGTALAHAAQYGDSSHEHNSIVCTLDALATQQTAIIPPAPITFVPVISQRTVFTAAYISFDCSTPQGRAPPPRGPPTLS